MLKSLAAYLLIVVPPLCGLLVILRLGQSIEPPRSIGGTWVIEATAYDPRCASLSYLDAPGTLKVAQSGPRAEVAFTDAEQTTLAVQIEDDHVTGEGVDRGNPQCGALALDARLDSDKLTGTLRRPGCDCPATPFHATRKPRTRR